MNGCAINTHIINILTVSVYVCMCMCYGTWLILISIGRHRIFIEGKGTYCGILTEGIGSHKRANKEV